MMDEAPTAEYLIEHGADPAMAAALAADAKTAGRSGSFNARVDLLHRIENTPPAAKPSAPVPATNSELIEAAAAHQDVQLADSFADLFKPQGSHLDIRHPEGLTEKTDAQLATELAESQSFHATGMPKEWINSMLIDVDSAKRALANESPDQRAGRLGTQQAALSKSWGAEEAARIEVVKNYVMRKSNAEPAFRDFYNRNIDYFTSQHVEHFYQTAINTRI